MGKPCKKRLQVTLAALLINTVIIMSVFATDNQSLPEMGTASGSVLSIAQEKIIGDMYVRGLRGNAPLIIDPLLEQYINTVGHRLVEHALSVKTPFNFYLMNNDNLNAFAFFGGNVVLHSALFRYVDNESQLAAVMSHEISHVTQRHLARAIEDRQRSAPLTWIGTLGSMLLFMANPQAGMAALVGTMAGTQQRIISFTQQNEQEADRLGMGVLQRSGFDPQAMPDFLQKLLDQLRYTTRPPEMLLTHPLPESRLSDARDRASQMRPVVIRSSQDFYLAKARILAMYAGRGEQSEVANLFVVWQKGDIRQQRAAQYGVAIQALVNKEYAKADQLVQPLLSQIPDSPWLLDLATDIDIGSQRPAKAVARLRAARNVDKNPVLQINLANALLNDKQYVQVVKILNRYTFDYPQDSNGWDLLAQAQSALGHHDQVMAANAELQALKGDLDGAIRQFSYAANRVKTDSLQQARYDARIDQLRKLRSQFEEFKK